MYSILFHITGLSLVEIIFYFYYIGRMESNMFSKTMKKLFESAIHNNLENHPIQYNSNIANFIIFLQEEEDKYIDELRIKSVEAKEDRKIYNEVLYTRSIHYWSLLCGISVLYFMTEVGCRYLIFRRNQKALRRNVSIESGIEMIEYENVRLRTRSMSDHLNEVASTSSKYEEKFINWKKVRKLCMYNTVHYFILIILILGFEYWFFNEVIMKYKIISAEELEYDAALVFEPFVNSHIENT